MPHFPAGHKQSSLRKLVAISTMLSPTHQHADMHLRPLIAGGGGEAKSEIPPQQLYLSHAIQEHLRRVYDGIRGAEALLTKAQFEGWLASVQDQVIEGLAKDVYKFEEFLETAYYNRALEAVKEPGPKDLSMPLSNYYISSSHNTYLIGNQLSSRSSTESYKNVLMRGCRCIEIDVHNGETIAENKENGDSGRSRSSSSPSKSDGHKRQFSGSTMSSRAATVFEEAQEKAAGLKSKLGFRRKDAASEERGRYKTADSSETPAMDRQASIRSIMNGEPLVLHGWTFTAPVGFRAVCKSIRETAFVTSTLPIIVSLEVHADMEQQEVMVKIMKEEWSGLLIESPNQDCDPDTRIPRLEELEKKILVKVKKATADKQDTASTGAQTLAPISSKDDDSSHSGSEDDRSTSSKRKKVKICAALSNLGVYTHSEHFSSFTAVTCRSPPHIFSISESQILELHEKSRSDMVAHNRDFFMRAYPAGFRVDSSNMDPSAFWRKGVQMVAMNWQTLDEGMMLNEGMFAAEHGWVLKPPGFRSDPAEAVDYKCVELKITLLSGQHIPLPPDQTEKGLRPYIKCELHVEGERKASEDGDKDKTSELKEKTEVLKGDHPDFGQGGFEMAFRPVGKVVEELSFLRFKLADSRYGSDELAAWACIRLDRLQPGYRFVQLLDAKAQMTAGLLLIKVQKVVKGWK